MTREIIVKELREILKVYHYASKNDNDDNERLEYISKNAVTSLENLLGQLLREQPKKEESNQLEFPFPELEANV